MKKSKDVYISKIDLTCRIVDVEIEGKSYELDFDIIDSEVLITTESIMKVKTKNKHWWLANGIENYIKNTQEFKCRNNLLFT